MRERVEAITSQMGREAGALSPRPAAVRGLTFQEVIDGLLSSRPATRPVQSSLYSVRSGDTLCSICEAFLKQTGKTPSRPETYAAVQQVAAANGLKNPDLLSIGQTIDLSVLSTSTTQEKAAGSVPSAAETTSTRRTAQSLLAEALDRLSPRVETPQPVLKGSVSVSSNYGMRRDPFAKRTEWHSGVDLAAKTGTSVYPAMSGTVTFSGWQSGYGRVVILQHDNGVETVYAHNSRNLAHVGDRVTGDKAIARVGSSGRATGSHLHFEVRKNGKDVNPSPYLTRDASLQIAKAF